MDTSKWTLESHLEIRATAEGLVEHLKERIKDEQGKFWTDQNFTALRDFAAQIDSNASCFHKPRLGHEADDRKEFLWDFIACRPSGGISLVAESEQQVTSQSHVLNLKHDFEKLLYVFAPLRVLIAKAESEMHAKELTQSLSNYANGCCRNFNPGSAFILHFCLFNKAGSRSYIWQSDGDPAPLKIETLEFGEPI